MTLQTLLADTYACQKVHIIGTNWMKTGQANMICKSILGLEVKEIHAQFDCLVVFV